MTSLSNSNKVDSIITGGGMAGISLACALASNGLRVALLEARSPESLLAHNADGRTSAISYGSAQILKRYNLWDELEEAGGPIWDIRVSDSKSPLFLHYDHSLIGNKPMGHIIDNLHILRSLYKKAETLTNLHIYAPARYTSITRDSAGVRMTLADTTVLEAKLLVGADGRNSHIRREAGIETWQWGYDQVGIVCNIHHEKPHNGLAEERFLPAGPFAVLPMAGGHHSSLVWTERTRHVPLYMAMDEEEFIYEIEKRVGTHLGKLTLASERFSYPLSLVHAKEYTATRLALIGDAAHAIHPIAGQGFNLGIRDIGILAERIITEHKHGLDIGSASVLADYNQARRADNTLMITITDSLTRLFSNRIAPLRTARILGMAAVEQATPLKKFFMRHAMGMES